MRGHLNTGWYYSEISEKEFVQPKDRSEGHYNGNVILLTSNHTFSSASSFAWAESAYLNRVSERTITVETAAIRTATEELYHRLCINLCYLANKEGADASERAKIGVCQRVVDTFNQLVKEFRQKINSNGESPNGGADDINPDDDAEIDEMMSDED